MTTRNEASPASVEDKCTGPGELILTTFDWVPETPRGYVRDIRVRWALEEAGLPYRVKSVPFGPRGPGHFSHQPFGQVPWLTDGSLSIFESGAILLHLGQYSEALMPADRQARSSVMEWLFAALNSVEMASLPWSIFKLAGEGGASQELKMLQAFLDARLQHMEAVLSGCAWLAGSFSVADILMADVLRLVDRFDGLAKLPACRDYLERATARPCFVRAHQDQLAHFGAADVRA
ncbi:glutathione S-transferase family protein [Variovorax sp. OV329]|uniref:glutathione S-transferase family protein n=1 Tax=Variovorax sp. OV329 TaxID=1882825 RepID=UPI0008E701B1|nr:glutathione S-transferase family protein [Variovorax sp. OV329]SFN05520.1 glutathione S-transferase [Variovorax sp. OV329]